MRTKQEIKQAIAILRKKGGRIELVQANVLEDGMTERQAFEKFVTNVSDKERDENIAFAARDAARYATGRVELEELIPDMDKYPVVVETPAPKKERQTVSLQEFNALKRKVEKLEGFVDDLLKERRQRAEYQKLPETNRTDFIGQKEATELVGCSRETLGAWHFKGFITGYRKAGLVYYSKSELAASPVVQNFRTIMDRRK